MVFVEHALVCCRYRPYLLLKLQVCFCSIATVRLPSSWFLEPVVVAMSIEIFERIAMSYAGGPVVQLPDTLIQEHEGKKFLKLQCSHPAICRLLCGDKTEQFTSCKNASFAGSPKLQLLRGEVQKALRKAVTPAEVAGVFDGGDEPDAKPVASAEKKKQKMLPFPATLQVRFESTELCVLTPKSFKCQDVYVLLEKDMLECIFGSFHEDMDYCLAATKRGYSKKRKQASEASDGE